MREDRYRRIESVIKDRLKLQSTQKTLMDKFGIHIPGLHYLRCVSPAYHLWEPQKQRDFVILIGGSSNQKHTREYFESFESITA